MQDVGGEVCCMQMNDTYLEFNTFIIIDMMKCILYFEDAMNSEMIYPEHNDTYLQECLDNLKEKGIEIKL